MLYVLRPSRRLFSGSCSKDFKHSKHHSKESITKRVHIGTIPYKPLKTRPQPRTVNPISSITSSCHTRIERISTPLQYSTPNTTLPVHPHPAASAAPAPAPAIRTPATELIPRATLHSSLSSRRRLSRPHVAPRPLMVTPFCSVPSQRLGIAMVRPGQVRYHRRERADVSGSRFRCGSARCSRVLGKGTVAGGCSEGKLWARSIWKACLGSGLGAFVSGAGQRVGVIRSAVMNLSL